MRRKLWCLIGLILISVPTYVSAQADVYGAGDGITTEVRGRAACGTDPLDLNVIDTQRYETWAASEFAEPVLALRGAVPSPIGRDTAVATAPFFGVTISNPGNSSVTVTQVQIDVTPNAVFDNDVLGIRPATGWSGAGNRVITWTGSIVVSRNSAADFVARVRPKSNDFADVPVILRATTSAGNLSVGTFTTSVTRNNLTPGVSLTWIDGGVEGFAATLESGGEVETGQIKSFRVRVREAEVGNTQPIPTGTLLRIVVPQGWTEVTALGSVGFGSATVTPPTGCATGLISVATTSSIINSFADFSFTARAPGQAGAVGLYVFWTELNDNTLSPVIAARTEYVQAVTPPPSAGTIAGLTVLTALATTPEPMADSKFSVFGATLANPTDTAVTINRVRIFEPTATQNLFKSVRAMRPLSGWTFINKNEVQWNGSLTVNPHSGLDFLCEIQGDGEDTGIVPVPITVSLRDTLGPTYTSTAGSTVQRGGARPGTSLYFVQAGAPTLYLAGSTGGQARAYRVAVRESEGTNILSGTELRIAVPAGWSGVTAAGGQAQFATPVVTQPTPTLAGQVSVLTNGNFRSKTVYFSFSAVAPTGVLESLYPLTVRLIKSDATQVDALTEALVQVTDLSQGIVLRHLSPVVSNTAQVNQLDVELVGRASTAQTVRLELFNSAAGSWDLIGNGPFDVADQTMIGSVTSAYLDYFDGADRLEARVSTNGADNHLIGQDELVFIVSRYRLEPSSIAPPTTPQGRNGLALEKLQFTVQSGTVGLETLRVTITGSDPVNDVTTVDLLDDVDCDGVGEAPLWPPQPLLPDATARFGDGVAPLFSFDSATPHCAVVTVDVAFGAGIGNIIALQIPNGRELTSDVGAYPFPSATGYPVASSDVVVTLQDSDLDGVPDADEATAGTIALDADTDDDGLLDGEELGSDFVYDVGVDTDPLNPDTDGDGLPDGLEVGIGPYVRLGDRDSDGTPDERDPDPDDNLVKGTDVVVFRPDLDIATTTDPLDADTDDDGLLDGFEDASINGRADYTLAIGAATGSGETDPLRRDTDGDAMQDGTELGRATPQGSGTNLAIFIPDADSATTSSPLDDDVDDDGLLDGTEDANLNGRADLTLAAGGTPGSGETSPLGADTDGDGLMDGTERGLALPMGIGTNPASFIGDAEPTTTSNPNDDDTDDDGLLDGTEDSNRNGRADYGLAVGGATGFGETSPLTRDTDGDGLQDGTELGLVAAAGAGTDPALFIADADPGTTSSPLDDDVDDDGLLDGTEDANLNGRADVTLAAGGTPGSGETSPLAADTDGDGLQDGTEVGLAAAIGIGTNPAIFVADADPATTTSAHDDDTDDDGRLDSSEDVNRNGRLEVTIGGSGTSGTGETDPAALDTDGDGCQDGTEMGIEFPGGLGTDPAVFQPDVNPLTTTSPIDTDTDDDGRADSAVDVNCNGAVDPGEGDPTVGNAVLRNDELTAITPRPAFALIFTGLGDFFSLELVGGNGVADATEGPSPEVPGSGDDDDDYANNVASPWIEPEVAVMTDAARPLVFYQLTTPGNTLRMVKGGGSITVSF